MMVKYPIVKVETEDSITLSGLFLESEKSGNRIIMHIHGTSGSFYGNSFYESIANKAYENNIAFLSTNNRGAGVYEMEVGTIPHGSSLERFEDCLLDINAWIEFCIRKGYSEIIVIGHSFGTEKLVYYMEKGLLKDHIKAVILLGFSDTIGTQEKYEREIGRSFLKEAQEMIAGQHGDRLLSDLQALAGELPVSASSYINLFSKDSEISKVLPLRQGGELKYFSNIKVPILCVISDDEQGEYTIIPIKSAMELLKKENGLAEVYEIKGTDHGFKGKEIELANIIFKFLGRI